MGRFLLIQGCIFLIFIQGCSSSNTLQQSEPVIYSPDSVVKYAMKFLGSPYKWAGNSPEGFDCSGFVSYVYKNFGINLPRSSSDYNKIGKPVDKNKCKKGDIILFSGTDMNLNQVGHVGIIISNPGEPIEFIHSSSSKKNGGVVISSLSTGYYKKRFIEIKRPNN